MLKVVNAFKNALLVLIIVVAGHVLLPVQQHPGRLPGAWGGLRLGDAGRSWHDPVRGDEERRSDRQQLQRSQRYHRSYQEHMRHGETERGRPGRDGWTGDGATAGYCDNGSPRGASLRVLPPYPSLSAGSSVERKGASASETAFERPVGSRTGSLESRCAEELHRFVNEGLAADASAFEYGPANTKHHARARSALSVGRSTGAPGASPPSVFIADERDLALSTGSECGRQQSAVDGSFEDMSCWYSPL